MTPQFQGLIAAPFTAFSSDGEVALDVIERQAERLLEQGVVGAFVCGTTGESASLTIRERLAVAKRWVEVASGRLRVIVHIGANAIADSRRLGQHAAEIGADAIAAAPPSFFKPASIDDLVACCAAVAGSAPGLPFYYYHIPVMSGVALPMARFVPPAMETIPNLAGVKFTHENFMDFGSAMQAGRGRIEMMFGRDEILLSALPMGTRYAVGSTYNFMAGLYHRVIDAYAAGRIDEARQAQAQATGYIQTMSGFGGIPAAKVMMALAGIDCGPVRLPLRQLTTEQTDALRMALEADGFFEAIKTAGRSQPLGVVTRSQTPPAKRAGKATTDGAAVTLH